MGTRLLLEGAQIEEILARVRDEHGPQARIVRAQKMRVGGVAGFFAKQRFEVTVEVSDAVADVSGGRKVSAAPLAVSSLDPFSALMAAADSSDVFAPGSSPSPWPTPTPAQAPSPARLPASAHREMSTESPAFTAVLADLQRSLGGRTAVTACVEQAPGLDLPAEPVDERHAFARAFPPSLASSAALPVPAQPAPSPEPAPPPTPQNATFVSDSPACRVRTSHFTGEVAGQVAGEVAGQVAGEVAGQVAGEVAGQVAGVVQTSPPAPSPRLAGQLESLGLPADLVARAGLDDERLHLLRVLDALPPLVRPEPANGRLLVVVGEGAAVSTAAAQLAQLARLPHESVHRVAPRVSTTQEPSGIAPERTLSGPREVAVWAAGLGEQHPPMVVAIEVTPGDGAGLWVQEVTRALGVEEVWAVVDARHKAADSEAFLDDLGRGDGRVRALVVHGAQLTSDPGSTLGLDVPVALLDGRAATTGTWAGVLLDRMAGTL